MKATTGLTGVRMKGPMSAGDAFGLWLEKEHVAIVIEDKPAKKPKLQTPSQATPSYTVGAAWVDAPDDDKLERAEALGVTRVFACKVSKGHVRIALSYEGAKAGVHDAEVKSFFRKPTLVENLAEAELWANSSGEDKKQRPFAERRREAREKLFDAASDTDSLGQPKKRAIDLSGPDSTPGQSQLGSGVLGFKGMVRSRRVLQMQRCFVDCATPIRIDSVGQPTPDELDEDNMELPGSSAYMFSPSRVDGPLKIEDWFEERKNTIKAWPLMNFSEFLSFCRHAIKLCSKSHKPAAIVNCAALNELMDIAIRLHRHMDRLGTLGAGEMRFKARMFLHLQNATMRRVVHTSASAMAVFKEATEVFMTRLPRSAFTESSGTPVKAKKSLFDKKAQASSPSSTPRREYGMPKSGCYLCEKTDHYCSDRSKHPLNADGTHKKVSLETQRAIMQRIDNAPASAEWKVAEKKRVREFWSRRCAP